MKDHVAVVILAKDAEAHLTALEPSLRVFDEIIVVDDHSSDSTGPVAHAFGWKVIVPPPREGFDVKRDAGVKAVTKDWVFMLDTDERIPDSLFDEIEGVVRRGRFDFYSVHLETFFAGQVIRHSGVGDLTVVRLFRRRAYLGFEGSIHERLRTRGPVGQLATRLEHHTYASTSHYIDKINTYTDYECEELADRARVTTLPPLVRLTRDVLAILRFAGSGQDKVSIRTFSKERLKNRYVVRSLLPAYPILRFLNLYLWKRGYRDGGVGLKYAVLSAVYSTLKYVKFFEKRGMH